MESGFTAKVDNKIKIKKYFGADFNFAILNFSFSAYANTRAANGIINNNPKLFSENEVISNLFCVVIVSTTINFSFEINGFKFKNKGNSEFWITAFSNFSTEIICKIDSNVINFDWNKLDFSLSNIRSNVVIKEKLLKGTKYTVFF